MNAIPVPDLEAFDVSFGSIKHLPSYQDLPEDFQRARGPYCDAVSHWFFAGVKREGAMLVAGSERFTAKPGINAGKALAAVGAVLRSFEPSHEHKIAGAGYLLSQWFDHVTEKEAA